jgi:hypothetical protein
VLLRVVVRLLAAVHAINLPSELVRWILMVLSKYIQQQQQQQCHARHYEYLHTYMLPSCTPL